MAAKKKKDDGPQTARPTVRTVLGLDTTLLLILRLEGKKGTLYDRLRRELEQLADVYRKWPTTPPSLEERVTATNQLSRLMKQVYGVDRVEPEEDPGTPRR
jgi:hypothetical protein